MWVSALLGMASSFAECSLAQLYKERDSRGQFRGGPAWYMARGLGMRWMGVLFSILLLLAYGFIFNTVQANSVAHALRYAFDLPAAVSGGVLAVVVLLAILRGLRGVARLMQWIVPFMALLWIATSLLIGLWHITALPTIFATIFRCAFGWQEAAAGAVGYTISQALTSGFQRGMDLLVGLGDGVPHADDPVAQPQPRLLCRVHRTCGGMHLGKAHHKRPL